MKKAFSLIELLYAMLILGILLSITLPSVNQTIQSNLIISTKTLLNDIVKYQQNEIYPKINDYATVNKQVLTKDTIKSKEGMYFTLKRGLTFETKPIVCSDNSIGVYVYIKNPKIKDLNKDEFSFDSCTNFFKRF